MDDSNVPRVWKKARNNFMPEEGSVWVGKLGDFRRDSKVDSSAYDGVIGSYVLVVGEVGELTFTYDSFICDGQSMKKLDINKKGAIAVLGDLIANNMLEKVEGVKKHGE